MARTLWSRFRLFDCCMNICLGNRWKQRSTLSLSSFLVFLLRRRLNPHHMMWSHDLHPFACRELVNHTCSASFTMSFVGAEKCQIKSCMFNIFRVKVKCHSQQVLFLLIKKKIPLSMDLTNPFTSAQNCSECESMWIIQGSGERGCRLTDDLMSPSTPAGTPGEVQVNWLTAA